MEIRETRIQELQEIMSPREDDSHKGLYGHVLLICGSEGMCGAASLCAKASLRSGAGLVSVALPRNLFPIVQIGVPEAICIDRSSLFYGAETDRSSASASSPLERYDAVAIGCGMGASQETYSMVEHLLLSYRGPVVIDADGINSLCEFGMAPTGASYMDSEPLDDIGVPRKRTSILPDLVKKRKAPVILTPHPGEASRLIESLELGRYAERSREDNARELAETTGAIIVLKGHDTLIATANTVSYGAAPSIAAADIFINRAGDPGMATAGSGDVLTGVVTAMLGSAAAQNSHGRTAMNPISSVRASVYIHGRAGELAAEKKGQTGMIAGDIIESLPEAFLELTGR